MGPIVPYTEVPDTDSHLFRLVCDDLKRYMTQKSVGCPTVRFLIVFVSL